MKKFIIIAILITGAFFCNSCEEENGLTESEIIQGLKEALRVGTDSSAAIVSAIDGYYMDAAIKVLLPEEAQVVYNALDDPTVGPLLEAVNVDKFVEDVVKGINRTAEEGAKEVGPIFWDAITGLTISDGMSILRGADNAATVYLQGKTNDAIKGIYQPKIQALLDTDLVGNTSTNDLWVQLTTNYNNVANQPLVSFQAIPDSTTTEEYLADHSTQKALDGLFVKVAEEEKRIRENPLERVTDILKKVFGSLD